MTPFSLNAEQSELLSELLRDIPRRTTADIMFHGPKKLSNFTPRNLSYYLLIKYGNYKKCFSRLNEKQWTYHPDNQGRFSIGYFGTIIRWLFLRTAPEGRDTFSFSRNFVFNDIQNFVSINQDGTQLSSADMKLYTEFQHGENTKTHFEIAPEKD